MNKYLKERSWRAQIEWKNLNQKLQSKILVQKMFIKLNEKGIQQFVCEFKNSVLGYRP